MNRLSFPFILAALLAVAGRAVRAQGPVGVSAITPAQAVPGERLEVRISGWGFASANSVWVAADDLAVADIQVLSDSLLSAPLYIPEDAPPGRCDITVWGDFGPNELLSDTLPAAFLVHLPDLGIESVSPSSAQAGTTARMHITGYGFLQFSQGVRVEIDGLAVQGWSVLSDSAIAAEVFIPADAPPGAYTVRVVGLLGRQETPAELQGGFSVVYAPPDIALNRLEPATVYAGSQASLRIYGAGFTRLDNLMFAIEGLGFQNVRLISDGELAAEVSIPAQFPPGWYTASVQGYYAPEYATGAELARALQVLPALVCNGIEPARALPGERIPLTLFGDNFQCTAAQTFQVLAPPEAGAEAAQPAPAALSPPTPEPAFLVEILENVSGRPGDTVPLFVYGGDFSAPQSLEAEIPGLEIRRSAILSEGKLLLEVYIPRDAQPDWRTFTLTADYGESGIRRTQVPQGFQVLAAKPEFSSLWRGLLFRSVQFIAAALAAGSALRAWRRKRWQKQATNTRLPRRCRKGERRVQRGTPELQPGRWKVAAVRATLFTPQTGRSAGAVHTMPASLLKELDKAARARLLYGDTPKLKAQVREMARQFAGLVLTWQITSRTGKEVLLETRMEGGEAEIPFTFYQCADGKWRQRARWKAKFKVVDHLPHVIRAPLPGETSVTYSAYINREVHAYLKNVVAEAGRLR